MSDEREILDRYNTPAWMTNYLLDNHEISGRICEPCAGGNSITGVLRGRGLEVVTGDVDQTTKVDFYGDATCEPLWLQFGPIDWVVSNYPFNSAVLINKKALKHARVGVAVYLRVSS